MKSRLEVSGDPKKIEPPDRIGEELSDSKCPRLFARDYVTPGNFLDFLAGIPEDECEFGFGDAGMCSGRRLEEIGLLKMDFLGLRTLTVIENALDLIKRNHGKEIDLDKIPYDDPKVYELFAAGQTVAVFQFEPKTAIGIFCPWAPGRRAFHPCVLSFASARDLLRPSLCCLL